VHGEAASEVIYSILLFSLSLSLLLLGARRGGIWGNLLKCSEYWNVLEWTGAGSMSTPSKPGWTGHAVEKKKNKTDTKGFLRVGRWRKKKQKILELTGVTFHVNQQKSRNHIQRAGMCAQLATWLANPRR
jgi:hypothetical protein